MYSNIYHLNLVRFYIQGISHRVGGTLKSGFNYIYYSGHHELLYKKRRFRKKKTFLFHNVFLCCLKVFVLYFSRSFFCLKYEKTRRLDTKKRKAVKTFFSSQYVLQKQAKTSANTNKNRKASRG